MTDSGVDVDAFKDNPVPSPSIEKGSGTLVGGFGQSACDYSEKDEAVALAWLKQNCPVKQPGQEDSADGELSFNGSSIHSIDEVGITSLHAACSRKPPPHIVSILLNCLDEKTVNAKDWNNQTALHYALWNGASMQVISLLIDKLNRKSFNRKDKDGENALHYAFQYDLAVEIICLILRKAGMEQTNVRNQNGRLPFELYNKETTSRKQHMKKLLEMHTYMNENDQPYHSGLFKHILLMHSDDQGEFMNFAYLRRALNQEVVKPFSLCILFVDLIIQILVMVTFSFSMDSADTTSFADAVVLGVSFGWLIFREISHLPGTTINSYVREPSNFFDIIQLGLIVSVLSHGFNGDVIDSNLLVPCIGVSWIQLIFVSANLFYTVAVFVAALISIFLSLFPFAFVVSIISAAFAHMYRALGPPENISCNDPNSYTDGGWACSLSDSYFYSFVMTLDGGFAFLEKPMGLSSAISMVFAFIMGIVLLNMLIALVSDVFADTRSQSELEFWINRLRIVDELESIRGVFTICFGQWSKNKSRMNIDEGVKEIPSRISLNDWWNENREDWKNYSPYHRDVLFWYCNIVHDSRETPGFLYRISAFLDMSTWSEIFFLSKAYRKFVAGSSYNEDLTGWKKAVGWVGAFGVTLALCLKLIAMLPLGILTGGYVWEREVKEMLFFGQVEDMKEDHTNAESVENRGLRTQIDSQNETLNILKLQVNEMKKTLEEQNILLRRLIDSQSSVS